MSPPSADQSYLEVAPDAILLVRADGTIGYANPQASNMFGFGHGDEITGLSIENLVPERLRSRHVSHRGTYGAHPEPRLMGEVQSRLVGLRSDGSEFPCEIALSPVPGIDGEPLTMAIIRDATNRELLLALVDIRRHLLDELSVTDSLAEICTAARRLAHAGQAFVLVSRGSRYELAAVAGSDSEAYPYGELFDCGLADDIFDSDRTLVFDAGDVAADAVPFPVATGRAIGTPLVTRDGVEGVMVIAAIADRDLTQVRRTAEALASDAALAVQLGRSRRERRRLSVVEDRDRIARDLHDVVIQRLFAAGMHLQSAASSGINLKGRAVDTVGELDETIAVIRETIFRLTSSEPDLLDEMNSVASAYLSPGGFPVTLRVDGDLATVSDAVAEQLLSSLNEMVSNAVRHSEADTIDVNLTVGSDLVLEVRDDGVGFSPDAVSGFGLGNLTARARRLGGTATVDSRPGDGTLVNWRVPLVPPSA